MKIDTYIIDSPMRVFLVLSGKMLLVSFQKSCMKKVIQFPV